MHASISENDPVESTLEDMKARLEPRLSEPKTITADDAAAIAEYVFAALQITPAHDYAIDVLYRLLLTRRLDKDHEEYVLREFAALVLAVPENPGNDHRRRAIHELHRAKRLNARRYMPTEFVRLVILEAQLLVEGRPSASGRDFRRAMSLFDRAISSAETLADHSLVTNAALAKASAILGSPRFQEGSLRDDAIAAGALALRHIDADSAPDLFARAAYLSALAMWRHPGDAGPEEENLIVSHAADALTAAMRCEDRLLEANAHWLYANAVLNRSARPADELKTVIAGARRGEHLFRKHGDVLRALVTRYQALRALILLQESRPAGIRPSTVRLLQKTAKAFDRDWNPDDWAAMQSTIAYAFRRMRIGDYPQNIENAITYYRLAGQVHTDEADPYNAARNRHDLALCLQERATGSLLDNRLQASKLMRDARRVYRSRGDHYSAAHIDGTLGELSYELYEGDPLRRHARDALRLLERSARSFTRLGDEDAVARTLLFKAETLIAMAKRHHANRLGEARAILNELLASGAAAQDPYLKGKIWWELGDLHALEAAHGRAGAADDAVIAYDQAAELIESDAAPDLAMRLSGAKARILMSNGDPSAALKAYDKTAGFAADVAAAHETLEGAYYGYAHTRTILSERALALAQLGHIREAYEALECTKNRYLRSQLNINHVGIAPWADAEVSFLITDFGCGAFLQRATDQEIKYFALPGTKTMLGELYLGPDDETAIGGWFKIFSSLPDRWPQEADQIFSSLWDGFIAPVHKWLVESDLHRGASVSLSLHEELYALPLGVAWRHHEGRRRFWIEDWALSVKTASRALAKVGAEGAVKSIFCYDPGDIPGARDEAEHMICRHGFERYDRATREEFKAEASRADVVHAACHAYFDWDAPDNGGLALANGVLDVTALRELSIKPGALVVLSACESGLTDVTKAPSELRGLPAAFFEAGAGGLVSSLWSVSDRAALVLAAKFYSGLLEDGLAHDAALREAQIWLLHASVTDIDQAIDGMGIPDTRKATVKKRWRRSKRYGGSRFWRIFSDRHKALSSPANWGPFIIYM